MGLQVDWNRRTTQWAALLLLLAGWAQAQAVQAPPPPDVAEAALSSVEASRYVDAPVWAAGEKKAFTALFGGSHYDWIVTPAQVQRQGLDRAERSMMAAELSRVLAECGLSLPNTYLLERALGEGQRKIPLKDIDGLAQAVGAKNIVVPFVGHDDLNNLMLTLAVYRKSAPTATIFSVRPTYLTANPRRLSDEVAPIEVFAAALPELLNGLGLQSQTHSGPGARVTPLQLPQEPERLGAPQPANPLADAARFAVLGEIAPLRGRGYERLFEKSLLAARLAPPTDEQQFLYAYALFRLNLRPAAVRVLQGRNSPAAIALTAIVNGNLTGTETLVQRTSGYERLILEIQLDDLAYAYGHKAEQPLPPSLVALAGRSGTWATLLESRWNYLRSTRNPSNIPLKRILDRIYPLDGQSLDDLLAAHAVTPGIPLKNSALELSVHEHVRHLMETQRAAWCCASAAAQPTPGDFLSVIDSWSDVNLFEAVEAQLFIQGSPENAREMLTELDPYYGGHPELEVLHAQADNALMRAVPEAQRETFRHSGQLHALQALLAAGGQTESAIEALTELYPGDPLVLQIAHSFSSDYPLNPYWLSNDFVIDQKERLGLAKHALANTQTGVSYISLMLLDGGDAVKAQAAAALQGRFRGNQGLEAVQRLLTPTAGGDGIEIARLRKKLRAEPDVWDTRIALAALLIDQTNYAEAARILAEYPGFNANTHEDRIDLSSLAAQAGRLFYWRGAEKEARLLYQIATRYDVGSEDEMIAATRLRLLDDDLDGALEQARLRAERYPDDNSYATYLSLLHLVGRSAEAWRAFNLLINEPMGPGPWESAMVGQRIAGLTQDGMDRWLARPEINQAGTSSISRAAAYLLMWSSTDRAAVGDLGERVRVLNHEPRGLIEGNGPVASYPGDRPDLRAVVSRSGFGADRRLPLKYQTPVESDKPLFARALVAFQRGDFVNAVSRFDELAARYPIETRVQDGDAMYALPDFAYACAKVGDPLKLEAFIAALPRGSDFFEVWLARAYFEALAHHDDDAALKSLNQAFPRMEHYLGRTPSTEYQYADVAERLYRDTTDKRFRDKALAWTHELQRLQPWTAWAYVIEAELAEDPGVRRSALVKAMFLDRLSPRLKYVRDAELAAATAELAKGNPFTRSKIRKDSIRAIRADARVYQAGLPVD